MNGRRKNVGSSKSSEWFTPENGQRKKNHSGVLTEK
jgi:hypothetical protein